MIDPVLLPLVGAVGLATWWAYGLDLVMVRGET
jgi:hypothetical protein